MVLYVVAGCTAVGLLAAMYDVGYKEITWKEFSNRSVEWLRLRYRRDRHRT